MRDHQQYIDAYHAAMQRERELWTLLADQQPGTPRFNRMLWTQWLDAIKDTNEASKALREAFRGNSKPGDL
jgi:hypothetical protein